MKKYELALNKIKEIIDELEVGELLPSVRDLMSSLDVSQVTVTRALKELKNDGIIFTRIGEGTFKQGTEAKSPGTVKKLLMLMPDYPSFFSVKIQRSFKVYFEKHSSYNLKIVLYDYRTTEFTRSMIKGGYDAVIVYPDFDLEIKAMASLLKLGIPVLVLDTILEVQGIDSICVDNKYGGTLVADWFIKNGYRRTAMLLAQPPRATIKNRRSGFENHLRLNEIDDFMLIDSQTASGDDSITKAYEKMLSVISEFGKLPFDAVFCDSDLTALGLMKACRENNIRIPEDLSVIGFDNVQECDFSSPPLSSVEQNLEQWAAETEKILSARFAGEKETSIQKYIIPSLVLRESAGKMKSDKDLKTARKSEVLEYQTN